MQFNTHSDEQDLISDITFWTGVGVNSYTLKARTRSVNEWQRTVWTWIFESYGGWKFMDDNTSDASTGIPSADQTITSGTGLYGLPSGALVVDGIQMKPSTNSVFLPLKSMTYEEFLRRGGDGAFPSTGVPEFYIVQGDIIRLLPIPNFTLASALRTIFEQDMVMFVSSDTTKVPGFAVILHRVLSIGASLDWCSIHKKEKVPMLAGLLTDYEKRIKSFYSKRFKARFPGVIDPGTDLMLELT